MSTPQQILDACFAAFPFRASLQVEEIEQMPGGRHDTTAFQLAAVGGEPAVPLVLRRFQARLTRWHLFDEAIAARTFAVLSALHDAGFPVPEPLTVTRRGPNPWMLVGRPAGEPLTAATLPPSLDEWADLLARLHSLGPRINDEALLPQRPTHEIFGTFRSWAERAGEPALLAATARLAPLVDALDGGTMTLLHGDWRPENCFASSDGLIVTNWENSTLSDPRWDVAVALNALAAGGAGAALLGPFRRRYESATGWPLVQIATFRTLVVLGEWAMGAWLRAALARGEEELPLPTPQPLIAAGDEAAHEVEALLEAAEAEHGA